MSVCAKLKVSVSLLDFFLFPRLELSYSKLLLCGLHGTCLSLGLVGLEIICFK